MTRVSVDEIMGMMSDLNNNTLQKITTYLDEPVDLENYIDHFKRWQEKPKTSEIIKNLNHAGTNIEVIKETYMKNKEYIKKVQASVEELKKNTKKLEEVNEQSREKIITIEQNISCLVNKQKNLQEKRDKILVLKLLTSTHFCYDTKKVRGYVIGSTPNNIQCFDFNQSKTSKQDITDSLYAAIKKVYREPPKKTTEKEEQQ